MPELFESLDCMLGLVSQMGIRDLAVQHGCTEAVNTAVKKLHRSQSSLPEAQQSGLALSKLLFTTAALLTALTLHPIGEVWTANLQRDSNNVQTAKVLKNLSSKTMKNEREKSWKMQPKLRK
ncbi:origin recognition complex subunit 6-like [Polyodon spathula]|uniref:origin recognition complex subunit 6-like n=1 Tax=Polyodon spathula TaxID=7913 RepID=UPI001B7E8D42|nr:origin recognition complex subunit 6-like [Polyodon spathula]